MPDGWLIRAGRDLDGPAIIALISGCWSAYPGLRLDVDGEMPQLHALAAHYAELGGRLWVAEADGLVAGMIAVRPSGDAAWEICQVYVAGALHGTGLAHTLLDVAERHAVAGGAERLELWSDTRFDRAHRFYEKRSYVRSGPVRVLADISDSLEFGYAKPVNGVLALDIAAAGSAERRLAEVLVDCVAAGASVGFLPPLSGEKARAFWHQVASDVGAGGRALVAAWRDGVMVGAGLLDLAMPEDQLHRAEVQTILVHPTARRRGLGRGILRALEAAALAAGRTLLTLYVRAGEAGEALCRCEGWQEAGLIPGYVADGLGVRHDAVLFRKRIA